ncbi:MAG: hypothetical protein JNL44_18750, partial [Gemmatimonadetes bacterium]|nr:hypothetical protein [Gemmatimonadota bacterium]
MAAGHAPPGRAQARRGQAADQTGTGTHRRTPGQSGEQGGQGGGDAPVPGGFVDGRLEELARRATNGPVDDGFSHGGPGAASVGLLTLELDGSDGIGEDAVRKRFGATPERSVPSPHAPPEAPLSWVYRQDGCTLSFGFSRREPTC